MFKKLLSLIMCLFILSQTTAVFATSISDLYGIEYLEEQEWKEEDKKKGTEVPVVQNPPIPVIGATSDIKLNVNGKNITFPDQQPIVIEGRTFIPMRFLAEALGARVYWDQDRQLIAIENKGIQWTESEKFYARYYLRIGEPQLVYAKFSKENGYATEIQIFELPQAPFIVNGRTMLPFRYLGELLGALVFYDDTTHTAMAVYGQHNDGASLNSNYDNATRKYLTLDPIPILSTLSENVFKEQLEILRTNAKDMVGAYKGTTLNGELSAAATWKTIDQSIAGYNELDKLYGGHSNSDKTQTGVRFFHYYLTNKYSGTWPNVGPFPDQYAENITNSQFQPATGMELVTADVDGRLSKSLFSTINVNEVLQKSDYWYYRLNNVWGLKLLPLNDDSFHKTINGYDVSKYKSNYDIIIEGYPMFSFSLIKYWDKEMYRAFARAGLIPWINSKGHRKNLLRVGDIQFGFGARYTTKECIYTFISGPDKTDVFDKEYFN